MVAKPDLSRLPRPTDTGSYWFGPMRNHNCPAILRIGAIRGAVGKWMVYLGEAGFVWERTPEGTVLRAYDTPEAALEALRAKLR